MQAGGYIVLLRSFQQLPGIGHRPMKGPQPLLHPENQRHKVTVWRVTLGQALKFEILKKKTQGITNSKLKEKTQ